MFSPLRCENDLFKNMDSYYLSKNIFNKYESFDLNNFKKDKLSECLRCTGVYVLILNKEFGRLIGSTDILYIGQSGGAKNGKGRFIYERLNDYRVGSKNAPQDKRIHDTIEKLILKGDKVILFYKKIDKEKCKIIESELLRQFFEEHLELPPLNRQS
ncbi:hypothetical protein A3D54_01190 [Candidatus Falkowbacteria bacterium RIFCSPHIGHO2_02_FULL_45_15]|uniref:GIY-YIG domain-containing protein n=1 Tax=Candidatus Falkowbacteria bacterium RIFCSPHIGHO2_02_FULL_45_15 TaxID=1797987 RepID=A0A1F5RMV0_9BACT|nr:MAG: hypothetical protein A3D54_01190 [Candidatus Falkowbacteria bacterium RIFCSPHIGHO2_02_FULL_45_15]